MITEMDMETLPIRSARECDALQDAVVTLVPPSQSHVVFKLRRVEDDRAPWITELDFLLFNAQGDMLQVLRGATPSDTVSGNSQSLYFGENNFKRTRATSKEMNEREVVEFSMTKLHPFVEVVGILVTTAEDEIVRSPQLNAFSLSCDLYAPTGSQANEHTQVEGKRSALYDADECTRLLSTCHDPRTGPRHREKQPNIVLCGKFFRRPGQRPSDWAFHAATKDCSNIVVRSVVTASLVESMQVFLLDLIPDMKISNRNPLTSVSGICAALTCNELLGIERHFLDDGLCKADFARLLLWEFMRTRSALMQHVDRATALVGLLFEMFEQIDINGDAMVNWEEFTSFCTALGHSVTRVAHDEHEHDEGQSHEDSHTAPPQTSIMYRQKALSSGTASRTFPYQINKIKSLPLLKRLAVMEHKSPRILIFDLGINFLHEFDCGEKLAAEKKRGKKLNERFDVLEVLDAEHIPSRNVLAVATSDWSISLWSIIDATIGTYVYNGELAGSFPVLFIKWCPLPLKRLFIAGGVTEHVQLWDLEIATQPGITTSPLLLLLPQSHTERIAACLDLPESPYIATASFDHTVTIWETIPGPEVALGGPSAVLIVSSVLRGHQQGVLTLDSAHSLLLTSGFEYQAYCWGLAGRVLKTKLGGHHHCLMGARFVSTSSSEACLAVTGDQSGHFKLWDLTRCAKGFSGNHLASMVQTFELHTPNLCRFRMFTIVSDKQLKESGSRAMSEHSACDIVTGNLRLYRFSAFTPLVGSPDEATGDEAAGSASTRFIVFNAVTNTFVGAVENRITVWNANSGLKMEDSVLIRHAEICAITFDSPRERKLFVATSDGAIRLYNPVTGALLRKLNVHDGPITSLVFCSHANCLVSTGDDQKICLLESPPGKLKLEMLHCVEKSHNTSITCCACSWPIQSTQTVRYIATGDDAGGVHVHDLHRITFKFRCANVHTREIRVLHFPAATPGLLISGDVSGAIFVWSTNGVRTLVVQPLLRLMMQEIRLCTSALNKGEFDGITAMCSTNNVQALHVSNMLYVGIETGQIFAWDLCSLPTTSLLEGHAARRLAISQRHSQIEGLARAFETNSKSAVLPVIVSTKSWMAHRAGVLSVQSVLYPGELLSLGVDGVVKIWDDTGACIGHIVTTAEQSAASASAWKYIRRDHLLGGYEKQVLEQIAREVIAKHERRLKKELNCQRKLTVYPQNKQLDSLASSLSFLEPIEARPTFGNIQYPSSSTVMTNAASALLTQVPFSLASVASGVRQGLFSMEEAHQLRFIAKTSKGSHENISDKRKRIATLAPLFSSPEKLVQSQAKATTKACAKFSTEPQMEKFPSQALKNFPLELKRRAAVKAKSSTSALRFIDVEPSMFLQNNLQDDASLTGNRVKSTPKKRLHPRGNQFKMNTILAPIGSLPKLPPFTCEKEGEKATAIFQPLNSSASAPVLTTVSMPLKLPHSSSPEKNSLNIERKLKLYQTIAANGRISSSKAKL